MSDTYALYEDAGKFLAGRVLSEAESSLQVELDSGKRVKVKSAHALLRFAKPGPSELLLQAGALAREIDLDLIWDAAPDEEFGFDDIAREYFSAQPDAAQRAATLLRLYDAPHYFHRRGKGRFRKAPQDVLKQALVAIERKAQQAAQIEVWAAELAAGGCPAPVREQLYKILFKPDKNAPEYKAVVEASRRSHKAPLELLKAAGAISSPYQFHWRRFLFDFFPKGTAFPPLAAPLIRDDLPLAPVRAFSIDDSSTTEIDDALSVQGLGTDTVTFGVHIAAPALAILPGSPIDQLARTRWSTVYMPGHKLTMLPDDVVQAYTLIEGRECPAVSAYFRLDASTLEVKSVETRIERVTIAANLRHDQLDSVITEDSLSGAAPADYAFAPELAFAWRLAKQLKAQREVVRGKPENFNRPDYNFKLDGLRGSEPDGSETVTISERQRGSTLDLIVAEAMILANSHWGGWIAENGVPGIYRSQASMAPGVKVRMGTRPAPHAGMGVKQYTWATSPLRRYVDLANQWQIIACARHGRTAALAAPFKPKDAELFSVISGFETAYAAYSQFQNGLERYWTLRHLEQAGLTELDAVVMKDGLVRANNLPLVLRAAGCESLPRGARVSVRVGGIDLLQLDAHAGLVTRLDAPGATTPAADIDAEDIEEAAEAAAPLALAIDVQDADRAEPAAEPVD
jgi:exoribonuclease-2